MHEQHGEVIMFSGKASATPDAYRAIADPSRRAILEAIATAECTVGELARLLKVSQPAVSQHLQVLRSADLINERREGRFLYLRLRGEGLQNVHAWVSRYESFWSSRLDALAVHLDKSKGN